MKYKVSITRYEEPDRSVRQAVEAAGGLPKLGPSDTVFIKPNIVFWSKTVPFPKWGVITTSRVVEDMVVLLKEAGAGRIVIGEGTVTPNPNDAATAAHAFDSLGYLELGRRYGVEAINTFDRPFKKVDLGDGVELSFCADALESDLVVDLPVMKTHAQTAISLGIKNLKGLIDIPSRKKCHNADPVRNLDFYVSHLAEPMPPIFTLIDGIYTAEMGPGFDGRMHRSDLLVASNDVLAADLVGCRCLGWEPEDVPHLTQAAARHGRPMDLSDTEVVGPAISEVARRHEAFFPYNEDNTLPLPMAKMGLKGIYYHKYDSSLCTYCSAVNGALLAAIAMCWQGEPFDDVEVLTGKSMGPTPGRKKTILLGKCMYQAHKDNPDINEMLAIKGCPPKPDQIVTALHKAGIPVERSIFDNLESLPGFFMKRYKDKPEFEEAHFRVS